MKHLTDTDSLSDKDIEQIISDSYSFKRKFTTTILGN